MLGGIIYYYASSWGTYLLMGLPISEVHLMSGQESGLPCISPKCGSSDALTVYPKGDAYCFSCNTYFHADQVAPWEVAVRGPVCPSKSTKSSPPLPHYKPANVPSRGIQEVSAAYYGVGIEVSTTDGEPSHLHFPVYRNGEQVGFKIKNLEDKTYGARGSIKNPDLFGQKQAGTGGKLLIITEGEEDCMSAWQMLQSVGKNYRVVSLPTGANTSAIKAHLEWIEGFETITLNLDSDDKGKETAKEIAELLTPGKVKITSLPKDIKDANEYLLSTHSAQGYLKAIWNAKTFQPDGIVSGADIIDYMRKEDERGASILYPWDGLNRLLYGMREREIVTWTAGTGIGKSAVMREIEHHILQTTGDTVGVLALEESVGRTGWGLVAVEASLPLSIMEERMKLGYETDSPDVLGWIESSGMKERMHTLDHWGSTSVDKLLSKCRYMIRGLGCKWVVLDHLSIVVSAMEQNEDERKTIDRIMTLLRKLCEETGAGMHLVSHLKRIDGRTGHEQGAEVSLSHLRGSQAIAQLSDAVVAMERNQQADTEKEANLTRLRVLKNRYAGLTGLATNLGYDRETGRLFEVKNVDEYLAPPISEAGC
jgi:twinkle protein